MLKKITTLFLILILSTIVTTLSVFGWFTISDEGGEREQNTYFNSRRLFEAEMISTVYTRNGSNMVPNVVNYNSRDVYSQSTYMLKIGNINANTESNPHPLDIDIRIKPLVDINIRVFIIEEWINGSGQVVKTTPVNYVYNDTNFTYNQTSGAYEYNHVLVKDNSILIDFVNGIRTPNGAAINNGNQFNLTVYIEAKQANSPAVWDGSSYLVNGPIQTVNINFEKVTNPFFQRGVPVEIIHGDTGEKFSFIYNKNTSTRVISGLGSSTNPHILRIFIPYTIDYDVSKNGNELIITSKYRVLSHFIGIHDYVYSPAVIPVYQHGITYRENDIVFYNGIYYIKVNDSGSYIYPTDLYHWRPLGSIYAGPSVTYKEGSIVYDLETKNYYYRQNGDYGAPLSDPWAWRVIGVNYTEGQTYIPGDLVKFTYQGVEDTYVNVRSSQSTSPENTYFWKIIRNSLDYINGNYYTLGDIVKDPTNNEYYRYYATYDETGRELKTSPSSRSGQWQHLPTNPYVLGNTYNTNDVVSHIGKDYIWIGGNGQQSNSYPDTLGSNWNELTNDWVSTNTYETGDIVYYLDRIYTFKGYYNNTNTKPGDDTNWEIFGIEWAVTKIYEIDAFVLHNGSAWRALQVPGIIPPGQDFTVWEEIRLEWLPSRDI